MELVFCTNNQHKVNEVSQIMGNGFEFLLLKDINFNQEIEEPFFTLEENAMQKANVVHAFCGKNCFAEDTGLFIEALEGEPGIFSARYAGEPTNSKKNIEKVLEKLHSIENRNAYFKTVIACIINTKTYYFLGECHGTIALQPQGIDGFGYDPIFIANGHTKSFAEILAHEKNSISHRKKAFEKFELFLKENF